MKISCYIITEKQQPVSVNKKNMSKNYLDAVF